MSRTLALVESPAQLLNAVEWAYTTQTPRLRAKVNIAQVAPTNERTRTQMKAVAAEATDAGFQVGWIEARASLRHRLRALRDFATLVAQADRLVIGDPYSGMIHTLLNVARDPGIVVVDDGTATMRYAEQWASDAPLVRWHERRRSAAAMATGTRAQRLLGHHSPRVSLFTAMPIEAPILALRNTYDWTRDRYGRPELLDGADLMGSSLVETGVVREDAYLAGVARLVAQRGVRRYLPHRHETREKLAKIEALGLETVRPDLPMEMWARRGPIGRTILSFPSTVLHTLPIVLRDVPVTIEPLEVDESWYADEVDGDQKAFVRGI